MDNLTHSLVGLSLSKAGLERLSPYATTVCLISANAADSDSLVLLFGDRWTALEHHRGITHSILGTIVIGVLIPILALLIERLIGLMRKRPPQIRIGGLIAASLIAAATHPFLDWTNNYGVRPLLPWSPTWLYGDLVFIMDPYIWLVLGGAAFLLTSNTRLRTISWGALAVLILAVMVIVSRQRGLGRTAVLVALCVWIVGVAALTFIKISRKPKSFGRAPAFAALIFLLLYWGSLWFIHNRALDTASQVAHQLAGARNEQVLKVAAMPSAANPFRWQSLAETDRAMYKYDVALGAANAQGAIEHFEKPQGPAAQLLAIAQRDRRAGILFGFARFPAVAVEDPNCLGRTLVQIADLRYTEPGRARANFSVSIPVDCPTR